MLNVVSVVVLNKKPKIRHIARKKKGKSLCERNLHLKTLFVISMVTSSQGYVLRIRYVYLLYTILNKLKAKGCNRCQRNRSQKTKH